jgi:hypothetical protein
MQRLTSNPLVLVGLSCDSSSVAKAIDELPTSRTVVALRRGHLALLIGRQAELPTSLSSNSALESMPAAYLENLASPSLYKKSKV